MFEIVCKMAKQCCLKCVLNLEQHPQFYYLFSLHTEPKPILVNQNIKTACNSKNVVYESIV